MLGGESGDTDGPLDIISRRNLCIAQPHPNHVLHHEDAQFQDELGRLYAPAESRAAEEVLLLKRELLTIDDLDVFWSTVVKGMAQIAGAQLAIVSKRVLIDDQDSAVEMPPIGEPGSCLVGKVFYYDDGRGTRGESRNFRHHAYGCPAAFMRHDKVFIIPDRLNDFIVDNPNQKDVPFPCESYIGVPLFAEGRCLGHFALCWTAAGTAARRLSWAFVEMVMHSLEDIILSRLLGGRRFSVGAGHGSDPAPVQVIPNKAVTPAQSLRPYARSLSHELRTPMQGIVGMLDIMTATVQEGFEGENHPRLRQIFETLMENIETVQDCSRRVVEAADNIVHAYDLNMGVPDALLPRLGVDPGHGQTFGCNTDEEHPELMIIDDELINYRGTKRRRESYPWKEGSPTKVHVTDAKQSPTALTHERAANGVRDDVDQHTAAPRRRSEDAAASRSRGSPPGSSRFGDAPVPELRHTRLRDLLQYVVNDGLKVGGRPESAIAQEIDGGEFIEVRVRSSSGVERTKTVEWSVDPSIPDTIFADERDLSKLISCVFLNAVKFTEQGRIKVAATLSPRSRYILVNIADTGCGIPTEFLPDLFKAFTREDQSITRQSEGLGLGLLVAKGLARKLHGDLACVRSETTGPARGSEFEIRIPVMPGDEGSRPGTPFLSPTPTRPNADTASTEPVRRCSKSSDTGLAASQPALSRSTSTLSSHFSPLDPFSSSSFSTPPFPSHNATSPPRPPRPRRRPATTISSRKPSARLDSTLGAQHPLTFLVAEDNPTNREFLVRSLAKLGYTRVHVAIDGLDAVRQTSKNDVDVVLMDLWMPFMNGYEAAERILNTGLREMDLFEDDPGGGGGAERDRGLPNGTTNGRRHKTPTILALTADATGGALEKAKMVGMKASLTKPYGILDLQRLIVENCVQGGGVKDAVPVAPVPA